MGMNHIRLLTPEEKSHEATSNTDIEGADVTCWGTVPSTGSSNREGPIANDRQLYDMRSVTVRKNSGGVSEPRNQP